MPGTRQGHRSGCQLPDPGPTGCGSSSTVTWRRPGRWARWSTPTGHNSKDNLNINFKRNIDILEFLSKNNLQRPKLVVGFAAETNDILKFAKEKKNRKYCDWIIANDVSIPEIGFNSEYNAVSIIYGNKIEKIEKNLKSYIANKIAQKIINNFIQ